MPDLSPNALTANELATISGALGSILDLFPETRDDTSHLIELRRLRIKTASLAFTKVSG